VPFFRPRPDPARARRVLAAAAAAFLLGQLAVGAAWDHAPLYVRFPQGSKVVNSARRMGDAPYAALFGTSRFRNIDLDAVGVGLGPALAGATPRVFQASVLAGDPVIIDYLLREILAEGPAPALAVIEISPETLSYPAHWLMDHVTRIYTLRDVLGNLGEIAARGRLGDVAQRRLLPASVYRRELLTWLPGRPPPYLDANLPEVRRGARGLPRRGPLGVPVSTAPPEPTPKTVSGLRRVEKWLRDSRIGGSESRALAATLERCRRAGVRTVLVGVPVTSFQRALYTPEVEGRFQAFLLELALEGAQPSFVDYRARVPDALFEDNHHLNEEGGRYFGEILGREVIAPRWQRRLAHR
jgi:hypothetical protein